MYSTTCTGESKQIINENFISAYQPTAAFVDNQQIISKIPKSCFFF